MSDDVKTRAVSDAGVQINEASVVWPVIANAAVRFPVGFRRLLAKILRHLLFESCLIKRDGNRVAMRLKSKQVFWHYFCDFPKLLILSEALHGLRNEEIIWGNWFQFFPFRLAHVGLGKSFVFGFACAKKVSLKNLREVFVSFFFYAQHQ